MDIITDESFKYDLEKLESTSSEFIIVKEFYHATKVMTNSRCRRVNDQVKNLKIYKITENKPVEAVEVKRNNLMLFHGTSRNGVRGILKEGFKNSTSGWFGSGIYMTDCADVAFGYSTSRNHSVNSKLYNSIFVNEVLESQKLQTFVRALELSMLQLKIRLANTPMSQVISRVKMTTKKII